MKKRICFVGFADDRPEALKSLNQAISGINAVWDCTFVANGPEALAAAAKEPFDALVTYMHIPGMTGAELLQQVGQLYPKTLGFVLGDAADHDLIVKTIGASHQFVPQPCKPQVLITAIQRTLAADAWVSTEHLRARAGDTSTAAKSRPATLVSKSVPAPEPPPVPVAAPQPKATHQNNWLRWLLVPAAVALVIAAILWWSRRSAQEGTIQAQARTAPIPASEERVAIPPAPIATMADARVNSNSIVAAIVPSPEFDSIKVQAIFYRPSRPNVIINGITLGVGERINGLEVVSIGQTNVVLALGSERKTFNMK